MLIIIKDSPPKGITRTSTDRLLKDSGWGSSFKSEEDSDKASYLERKLKKNCGADESRVTAKEINLVK
jgi:hypothetical protein